ncbi:hypothetical protein RJ640_017700 [Escallonia rubra]|uniref:Pentatricopeptide repeat-containing protein n=1 Tax=Escallonia rubra TaxID=112253 RepID=A0AA88UDB4_9ASTE|nr:hypothetical protein RJ640_017700 [Escallonia rubra]
MFKAATVAATAVGGFMDGNILDRLDFGLGLVSTARSHIDGGIYDGVCANGSVEEGKQVHGMVMKIGLEDDEFVLINLVRMYVMCGAMEYAHVLFNSNKMGDTHPNYVTLVTVLPAISRLGALELGKWVHLYAERNRFGIDEVLGSALIDMYSKCGSIDKVLQLFESLSQKNVITWNAILGGLAMHGRGKDAVDFFLKMQQAGV